MSSSALKILSSFFSRSEIFERTFGLAHWVSRTDFVSLASILRALKTKEEQTHTKRWHGIVLLPVARMHVVARRLPLSPSSERSSLCDSFFLNVRWRDSPESRVKRCQIKYKMRCSPFAFTDAYERRFETLTFYRCQVLCFARACTSSMCTFYMSACTMYTLWGEYTRIRNRVTAV